MTDSYMEFSSISDATIYRLSIRIYRVEGRDNSHSQADKRKNKGYSLERVSMNSAA